VYTLIAPYSSSYPFPHHLSPPTDANPTPTHTHRTCSSFLFSNFVEEKI
jgi:hypothetical protein